MNQGDHDKFSLILDSARHRFDTIVSAETSLDQKAGILMGFEIAIIIGYVMIVMKDLSGGRLFVSMIAIILVVISLGILLYINWPQESRFSSVSFKKHTEYLDSEKSYLELTKQLLSDLEYAAEQNMKQPERKAFYFKWAFILLLAGVSPFLLIALFDGFSRILSSGDSDYCNFEIRHEQVKFDKGNMKGLLYMLPNVPNSTYEAGRLQKPSQNGSCGQKERLKRSFPQEADGYEEKSGR